jgi:prevent-host-death family protein
MGAGGELDDEAGGVVDGDLDQRVDAGDGAIVQGTATSRGLDMTNFSINTLVMKKVNVHQAKANLSRYLDEVERGETILVCRRNVPVAELRPVARAPHQPRPVGLARGGFTVPYSFFEPLPDEVVAGFQGRGD